MNNILVDDQEPFEISEPTSDSDGTFTYTSSDESVFCSWHFNSFSNLQYLPLHGFYVSRDSNAQLPYQMQPPQ